VDRVTRSTNTTYHPRWWLHGVIFPDPRPLRPFRPWGTSRRPLLTGFTQYRQQGRGGGLGAPPARLSAAPRQHRGSAGRGIEVTLCDLRWSRAARTVPPICATVGDGWVGLESAPNARICVRPRRRRDSQPAPNRSRPGATVNATLTAVREFVRFCAGTGLIGTAVAERLPEVIVRFDPDDGSGRARRMRDVCPCRGRGRQGRLAP